MKAYLKPILKMLKADEESLMNTVSLPVVSDKTIGNSSDIRSKEESSLPRYSVWDE